MPARVTKATTDMLRFITGNGHTIDLQREIVLVNSYVIPSVINPLAKAISAKQ